MKQTASAAVLAMSTIFSANNASADSTYCQIDNRQATVQEHFTAHQVTLSGNGEEIYNSRGALNGYQTRSIAKEFCEDGAVPPVEVNIYRPGLGLLKHLECKNTADNSLNATASLDWKSAALSLSDGTTRKGDITYNRARDTALDHCAGLE